jgi:O-antigen ligase
VAALNYVYTGLLVGSLVVIELLIGGTRLLFSLPSYGLMALASLLSLCSFRRLQIPANPYCLAAAGLFAVCVIVRAWFSPVEYLARTDLFLLLGTLMTYLLVALVLTMPKHRFIFVMALLLIGLVQVTIGAVQSLRGARFPIFDWLDKVTFGWRATGLYICPNHLAGYLEVSALLGLSTACWSRQGFWIKLLAGFGASVCTIGIVLTGSRGGYLSTSVGLVVFAALSWVAIRRASRSQIWISALGAVVVSVLLSAGVATLLAHQYPLQSRVARILPKDDVRLDLWSGALEQFKFSPVVGTGSGTYLHYGRLFRPSRVQADPVYAHNDYLQLMAEYGLIGLVAAVAFLLCHGWCGWRGLQYFVTERAIGRQRLQSDAMALNIGALSSLAIYAVHSLLDFNLHIPANAMLLAFVLGTLANPGVMMPAVAPATQKMGRGLKLALPAIGLWMAVAGLPTLPGEYLAEQARGAFKQERYEDAVALATRGLAADRKNPYLHLYLGQALSGLGGKTTNTASARAAFEGAVKAFQDGLVLYPQEQWLLVGLGAALDALGRFGDAGPVYLSALKWNPTCAFIHLSYATHLRLAGDFDEAEAMYQKSLTLFWNQGALHGLDLLTKARQEAPARTQLSK